MAPRRTGPQSRLRREDHLPRVVGAKDAEQMIDFFHEHTAMDDQNIETEVNRYIAWPAQALAYKLGQLEILKLRERAKAELDSKFDIRAFHDEILNGGALPLDMLEVRVEAWIAAQK